MMNDIAQYASRSKNFVTRYARAGSSNDVVLLIHGLGCSSLEWSENILYLSAKMTVIAVDLIGFGQSDKPNDFEYSPRRQAEELIALMDELGIHEFHVVGNSYGGRVAIEITDLLKDSVKSLTLVASAGGGLVAPKPMRISSIPFVGELMPTPLYEEFKLGWQTVFFDKTKLSEDRVLRKYQDSLKPGVKKSHLRTLRSMINIFGFKKSDFNALEKKIKSIQCPILIIWGRQDIYLPVTHAKHFEKCTPNSTVVIFEECGHAPQIEKAHEFNNLLLNFIFSEAVAK